MVDVNVETTATIFGQWIGELFIGFAENPVLGVLNRLAIVVALSGISGSLAC